MREFFKPWRKRVGVATLVMVCAFMAAWVRGQMTFDRVYFGWRDRYCVFHFSNETLGPHRGVFLLYGKSLPPDVLFRSEWISSSDRLTPQRLKELIDEDSSHESSAEAIAEGLWSWKGIGFLVGGTHTYSKIAVPYWSICCRFKEEVSHPYAALGHSSYRMFSMPYWSLAIPLTILSGYLLLGKPRPKPPHSVPYA